MLILCITPESDKHKTPEMGFVETLKKHGHNVIMLTTGYDANDIKINRELLEILTIHKPDIVWGMMEYALPTAETYARLLDVPFVAHIECIPPWRVGLNTPEEYGFDYTPLKKKHFGDIDNREYFNKVYKILLTHYNNADLRTIAGDEWRYTYEKFTGSQLDAETRYYTWNEDDLKKYEGTFEEKNQICTIARFTPIKRVHHIIRAISKIPKEIRPKYKVVGYGTELNYLTNLAKELDVDMELVGSGLNGLKERIIQESMFLVQIFAGIPVIESAYYSKGSICYDTAHMMEVYGNIPLWTKTNDINKLAECIETLIRSKSKRKKLGEQAKQLLTEGKTNIYTNVEFVRVCEKHFKQAIIRHQLKTNYGFLNPLITKIDKKWPLDYHHFRIIKDDDFKGKILDVGSGCCEFSIVAKQIKPEINIVALEKNKVYAFMGLALAKKSNTPIDILNIGIEKKVFAANLFDTVVLSHIFEHCSDINEVMEWLIKITKPGATIFMSFPYTNHHDSQEHLHYFCNKDNAIINTLNGKRECVNIDTFLDKFPISKEIEIIDEIKVDKHKNSKGGGYLSFYIKLKNNKKGDDN